MLYSEGAVRETILQSFVYLVTLIYVVKSKVLKLVRLSTFQAAYDILASVGYYG